MSVPLVEGNLYAVGLKGRRFYLISDVFACTDGFLFYKSKDMDVRRFVEITGI